MDNRKRDDRFRQAVECRARQREGERTMIGIQFVTDEKGRKVAVQIDLKKHRRLWEDIEDVLISRSRRREKRIPLNKIKASLIAKGSGDTAEVMVKTSRASDAVK